MGEDGSWERDFKIAKLDDEQHVVFGWLSWSVDKQGRLIVDSQDDVILPADLEKAAYDHVLYSRETDAMHEGGAVGRLIESMVFTKEKQAALGIPAGVLPECAWWVGYKVDDADTWERVKNGELRAFSIGGTGQRQEISDAA